MFPSEEVRSYFSLLNPSLSDKVTGLLRIQITDLFWNVDQRVNLFLVTFLLPILILAAATTDLHWDFLTGRVANKLSRGLLNILEDKVGDGSQLEGKLAYLGSAVRLEDCLTLLRTLAVTNLPLRSVTLLYGVRHSLLSTPGVRRSQGIFTPSYKPEGDLTVFLEVLIALLLLGRIELSDVGEVAFLDVLVDTL